MIRSAPRFAKEKIQYKFRIKHEKKKQWNLSLRPPILLNKGENIERIQGNIVRKSRWPRKQVAGQEGSDGPEPKTLKLQYSL